MPTKKSTSKAVVICTAKRGVFFGYTNQDCMAIVEAGKVTLERARMCTYWSADTKGVLGLAAGGPQKGSRIGPQVPEMAANEVTAAIICSDAAVEAWEKGPWS